MRYVFGFLGVFTLSLMLSVGCSETSGTGGSGGDGGTGGMTGQEFPCTEQGIRDAIAEGGGPHTFDCDGPTTVVVEAFIAIDNDVILDGEGNLTVDGNSASDLLVVQDEVTAELSGFTVTRGGNQPCDETNDTCAGIWNSGTLLLTNVTLTENGWGAANAGTLTMINTTVSENDTDGIANLGTLALTNSTVSGNARAAIANGRGTAVLTACTVSGAIENSSEGTLTFAGSLVAGNCGGEITSDGYNIESPGDTCGFDQTGDQPGVSAEQLNLGPLAANGGPTMTHKPGDGGFGTDSAAIDQIPAVDCEVDEDQRGEPRPGGPACDVGAVEVQP